MGRLFLIVVLERCRYGYNDPTRKPRKNVLALSGDTNFLSLSTKRGERDKSASEKERERKKEKNGKKREKSFLAGGPRSEKAGKRNVTKENLTEGEIESGEGRGERGRGWSVVLPRKRVPNGESRWSANVEKELKAELKKRRKMVERTQPRVPTLQIVHETWYPRGCIINFFIVLHATEYCAVVTSGCELQVAAALCSRGLLRIRSLPLHRYTFIDQLQR
ncbi:hypothetical protein HZH68_013290 [Vespula germanica]|uniref:Uncharacterized protein n=2 Tax=Vespula TaxID=7451 RepID=A0A834JCK3_VESGE|nr:hypothetical protein HZH66_012041 [Vespula vulgaris]KAF7386158.1 hypothetical protein HZH68_013290 [Vespula germanica]